MAKYYSNLELYVETCCSCKTRFAMSPEVHQAARERKEEFIFFCPNGHEQHYVSGQTESDKLRQERDRLKQEQARLYGLIRERGQEAAAAKRSAAAYKGAATRMKNRAKAGVCPCCNRTFNNLARHMASQHPDHELDNVVELGQSSA